MNEFKTILLKASDVAERLNISKSLAYRLMQEGLIPTVRFNHSVRVRQEDLEEFIQRNRSEQPYVAKEMSLRYQVDTAPVQKYNGVPGCR